MSTRPATQKYVASPAHLATGTLVRLFFEAVDRWSDRETLQAKATEGWRGTTYRDIAVQVHRVARALGALEVRRGDRVAILSENRPEWVLVDYATLCVGAIDVPIYATLPPGQVEYLLADCGARIVFVSTPAQLEKVLAVRSALPELEHIVAFDDPGREAANLIPLDRALAAGDDAAEEPLAAFRDRAMRAAPEDVATIIYTSGTTGRPKGVMLSHANLYSNVQACGDVLPLTDEDVALTFLPLSHVLQRMVDYVLFSLGCRIAYAESFDRVPANLQQVRPTFVVSVPRLYEKVYTRVMSADGLRGGLVRWARDVAVDYADASVDGPGASTLLRVGHRIADRLVYSKVRDAVGGRLRYFVSGGAPLEMELAKFFYSARLPILEGYGLTETSPVTNVNTPAHLRFGTVGRPVPGTEELLAPDGEILVRGPQVMVGYYKMPEETAQAIDAEGWFHTGDIGEIDADGYLRITDRKKDLIVTAGGKNIAPQPIENRVKANRFVDEAVMIGDRRPYPVLLVVPSFPALEAWAAQAGVQAGDDRETLLRDLRVQQKMESEVFGAVADFARYERPKKIALLEREFTVESGELTPSLKVRRRVVNERYGELVEALYETSRDDDVAAESELE